MALDWELIIRAGLLVLVGVVAMVVAPFRGSFELAAAGAFSFLVGSGLLAYSIWLARSKDLRNRGSDP
jgi:hypothetical protein